MDIVDLPRDLFLLIVAHLSARTAVACRRVSRRWNGAFADEDLSLRLLRWHFPRCREARLALAAAAAEAEASSPDGGVATTGHGDSPGHGAAEGQRARGGAAPNSRGAGGAGRSSSSSRTCWAAVFARVARRYHHLRAAAPRSVEKIRHGAGASATAEEGDGGAWPGTPPPGFLPVRPWDRHLRLHDKTAPFHYPDPGWCYGQDDGLLVYHAGREEKEDDDEEEGAGAARPLPWRWLDLETRRGGTVPFARRGGDAVVRRVRLADGVLVFEWCAPRAGRHPDHQACEDGDEEWLHFVTVYDVRRVAPATTDNDNDDNNGNGNGNGNNEIEQRESESGSATWTITQRSEFPLLPGWPINRHSRFFSTHTNTHYAAYIWQGDRTSRDNHPVDVVVIRDISTTPPGQRQQQQQQEEEGGEQEEPLSRIVRTMSWDTLDFYGVRQRSAPRLRCLGMDDRNLYLTEEEHRWARGAHSSPSPPRVHLVRTTGIPIIPAAPAAAILSSLGGGQEVEREGEGEGEKSRQVVVQGPRWVDECGANGDVNMSFCSRAAGATTRSQQHVSHPAAGGGGGEVHSSPMNSGIQTRSGDEWPQPATAATATAAAAGGAGRWPGWAPCWRHEEFPYLTVSEMVDLRAGVRVTARHCFMLETLSVHVRPSLSVRGLGGGGGGGSDGRDDGDGDGGGGGSKGGGTTGPRSTRSEEGEGAGTRARPRKGTRGDEEKRSDDGGGGGGGDSDEEVQFADEMWDALLGKGFICGDERWLIGEDRQGAITILRF